ncbi:Zinc finger MYM-type protein 1 [Frankliniella fusca]|uniref:Zinc finger MYM-type protein 1 n=1 Tax=Frankliniella fusca TaxID=407009 RepID=A0AAE1LT87_9NEOP|nr:Zinc finger MYM-type protein 1 [Frankliniella fusca]
MSDVAGAIPEDYKDLFTLYAIYLTLPITTATLERRFSKMAIIKHRLRSVMGQERLESLLLAATELDLTILLETDDLVAQFAAKHSRQLNSG